MVQNTGKQENVTEYKILGISYTIVWLYKKKKQWEKLMRNVTFAADFPTACGKLAKESCKWLSCHCAHYDIIKSQVAIVISRTL